MTKAKIRDTEEITRPKTIDDLFSFPLDRILFFSKNVDRANPYRRIDHYTLCTTDTSIWCYQVSSSGGWQSTWPHIQEKLGEKCERFIEVLVARDGFFKTNDPTTSSAIVINNNAVDFYQPYKISNRDGGIGKGIVLHRDGKSVLAGSADHIYAGEGNANLPDGCFPLWENFDDFISLLVQQGYAPKVINTSWQQDNAILSKWRRAQTLAKREDLSERGRLVLSRTLDEVCTFLTGRKVVSTRPEEAQARIDDALQRLNNFFGQPK